ncbi:hypothetical protein F8M41_016836 [Gigaspora margarita]|uniref:Uncharacterized protein n=1 Tax=Gigaspora margarita TaxID=4874 RepID=A0A8H4ANS9_GIGMA|nr:hypothetical protein F8M41_016836 [Gigaspora margarita]
MNNCLLLNVWKVVQKGCILLLTQTNCTMAKTFLKFKMNQPQPQQNVNIPINSSFDNLTAEQKYENLTKGTADLFNTRAQETEDRTIPQFSTSIISGTSF